MMFPKIYSRLVLSKKPISQGLYRNIGSSAVVLQKADPIQQLFLKKIREYYQKKSASKTGLIDSSPETEKALKDEIEKINRQYGTSASSEFPVFNFSEPKLEISPERLDKQ
ncbi:ATP synthase-coupling factor mitochondrial [Brachionus plicatilis]|uniref:ATP synthase-coupling factor mitochondrial n=1 Tax=Brachionus plicatilis TaxID=10195 RepID=A0A3M7PSL8_BRAPC|nr:ATP synthase-coupling factor mitochondrial [Brachionus plicatilis]